jgi:hypothetical protein
VSTGVYGIVRFVAICVAMYWAVDRFGRVNLLICGSVVAVSSKNSIGTFSCR